MGLVFLSSSCFCFFGRRVFGLVFGLVCFFFCGVFVYGLFMMTIMRRQCLPRFLVVVVMMIMTSTTTSTTTSTSTTRSTTSTRFLTTIDGSDEYNIAFLEPRDILIQIAQETHISQWIHQDFWLSTTNDNDICTWYGVTCYTNLTDSNGHDSHRHGHVQQLDLSQNQLQGTIPKSIWQLPYLEILFLHNNDELQNVDTTNIGTAQYLHTLSLPIHTIDTNNWESLKQVSNQLQHLKFTSKSTSTTIGMPIPLVLYQLTKLESLEASNCQLTGPFMADPSIDIGTNWQYMKQLNFNDNFLTGTIPTQLGQLSFLQTLQLSNNQFTGTMLSDLYWNSLTELRVLDLSRIPSPRSTSTSTTRTTTTGLTGPVPSFSTMKYLQWIDLSYQSLTGILPPNLVQSTNKNTHLTIDLRGNQFSDITIQYFPLFLFTKYHLDLYLADNPLTEFVLENTMCQPHQDDNDNNTTSLVASPIPPLVVPNGWLNGQIQTFLNCNGFLCPIGTFALNTQGRQMNWNIPCQDCPTAQYMGQTWCDDTTTSDTTSDSSTTTTTIGQEQQMNVFRILQEFFTSLNGIHWKESYGWMDMESYDDHDYCTWYGITCDNDFIIEIDLDSNSLNGIVPNSIFTLPLLQRLSLSSNTITLDISTSTTSTTKNSNEEFYMALQQATNLRELNLIQTKLGGDDTIDGSTIVQTLLQGLAQVNVIEILRLSSNPPPKTTMNGDTTSTSTTSTTRRNEFPMAIFELTSLQLLDLSHNEYIGQLDLLQLLSQLLDLRFLYLQNNFLSGSLTTKSSTSLSSSTFSSKIQELNLAQNQFTGPLPSNEELNDCCLELQIINVRDNQFIGTIPSWSLLSNVQIFNAKNNQLSGSLPMDFLLAHQQQEENDNDKNNNNNHGMEILLQNNTLTGYIPISWKTRFLNLFLDVTGNQLSGLFSSTTTNNMDLDCPITWMHGLVADYGCNAILCPPNTFTELGRQTDEFNHTCRPCMMNQNDNDKGVWGTRTCPLDNDEEEELSPFQQAAMELRILTSLYHETHGENWYRHDGWIITANYCTWYGISCDPVTQLITSINLNHNGLSGIPPTYQIWQLSALADLDLSLNTFSSFSFDGIEQAQNLLRIDLSFTGLSSVQGLDQSTSGLLELRFNDNALSGPFPKEILSLHNTLRRLSLNSNHLSGLLPGMELSKFHFLMELFLFDNEFHGPLPTLLGELSLLTYLGLSGNQWTGTIPAQLNQLQFLETLALQNNNNPVSSGRGLSGQLPALDGMPHLQQLLLGHHSLTGTIPETFLGGLENWAIPVSIDLTNNQLTGGLPASLARLQSLELYVGGNFLTEPIPSGICRQAGWMKSQVGSLGCNAILCPPNTYQPNQGRQMSNTITCQDCPNDETTKYYGSFACSTIREQNEREERHVLEELYKNTNGDGWTNNDGWMDPNVSICDWYGIDCESLESSTSILSIRLVSNGLSGQLPNSIFTSLHALVELDLSWNLGLDVVFNATAMSQATTLSFLNLDSTGLSSTVGLETAPALETLRMERNQLGLDGNFPTQLLQLPKLQALFLSNNHFGTTESAPPVTGWSTLFVQFECKQCDLQGPFPSFVGTLVNLEYLYVLFLFLHADQMGRFLQNGHIFSFHFFLKFACPHRLHFCFVGIFLFFF